MSVFQAMRPSDIYETMLITREKCGTEFFLNESDGFAGVDCPACSAPSSQAAFAFYKYGFRHLTCPACSTLYVTPRPTHAQLSTYYTGYDAPRMWTEILLRTSDTRKVVQHMPRVRKLQGLLEAHAAPRDCFVDLGAGNGIFAKAVAQAALFGRTIACDISPRCTEACQALGLETVTGTLESFAPSSLDCVSSNDLIEHLHDPAGLLLQLRSRLRDGGLIQIATPNGEGFDFKLLGDKTDNITPPEHLQYFNPRSISLLLERCGFEPIDVTTPGVLDMEIVKRHRNERGFDLGRANAFLEHLYALGDKDMEASFQTFLADNKLSSHMLVYARKV